MLPDYVVIQLRQLLQAYFPFLNHMWFESYLPLTESVIVDKAYNFHALRVASQAWWRERGRRECGQKKSKVQFSGDPTIQRPDDN